MPPPIEASVRARPRVLWSLVGLALALRVATALYAHAVPPVVKDAMHWTPAAQAQALAKSTGKPILYVFSATWCDPCKILNREVFGDEVIAADVEKNFVPVHVLQGGEEGLTTPEEAEGLMKRFQVQSFPTMLVVAGDQPSGVMSGYSGKANVAAYLAGGWRRER